MDRSDPRRINELLTEINGGRDGAFAELVEAVYHDLRRIAANRLAHAFHRPLEGLTLTPTALVSDAVMEVRRQRVQWQNREHFFAIATRLMLRLIEHYRRDRRALKRGGGDRGAPLHDADPPAPASREAIPEDLLDALSRLHDEHPRAAEVVALHAMCEHPLPRVAELVGVSLATVERDWRFANAWLAARMGSPQ